MLNGTLGLTNSVSAHINVLETAISALGINSLAGHNTVAIAGGNPYTGGIIVTGGDPSASDIVSLTGKAATAESVNITPRNADHTQQAITGLGGAGYQTIWTSNVGLITYTGVGGDDTLTVNTGSGDDTATVSKAAAAATDQVISSSLPAVDFSAVNTFVLNMGGGTNTATFDTTELSGAAAANYQVVEGATDSLVVQGAAGATNLYTVSKPGVGSMQIKDNTAGATQITLTETSGNLGQLQVNGGGANDTVTVDDTGGLVTLPGGITFNGYGASNTLKLINGGGATYTDMYTAGPAAGQGNDVLANGGSTQRVYFQNLAPVVDTVTAGSLTVNGNNADNAISYTQGPDGATYGLVAVDNYETIEFQNKTALTIAGQGGSDTISLNDASTPTGLTGIAVNGGDPTSGVSDILMVNGTVGATIDTSTNTITGAGPVTITYQNIEQVDFNGTGTGESLTVAGTAAPDTIVVTPGTTVDSGTVVVDSFAPIAFQNLAPPAPSPSTAPPGRTHSSTTAVPATTRSRWPSTGPSA